MPNELWNAVGALLIATAMLATHPLKPAVAQRLEDQIALNWGRIAMAQATCPADVSCGMPIPIQ